MTGLSNIQKTRLQARMKAALGERRAVLLTDAVAMANAGARLTPEPLDGMGVSVLLRAIGWNRDHNQPASAPISYRRNVA